MVLLDCHCDTISKLMETGQELYDNDGHVSLEKLACFDAPVQFFAIWLEKKYRESGFERTRQAIDFFYDQVKKNEDRICIARSHADILEHMRRNKVSGILAIEGGEALNGKMENLHTFYDLGVRLLTLTWNNKNTLGDGIFVPDAKGLTAFGKEVVREMNRLGMIIDVSHLSVEGFWDVFHLSKEPFVASHSNCFSLCSHVRNLNDEQIKAIASKDGVIGINLNPVFLNREGEPDITHVLKHIDYILQLVGEDYVGLGSDLDGIESTPEGFEDVSGLYKLYHTLEGLYGKQIADKIFGWNFMRVTQSIMP